MDKQKKEKMLLGVTRLDFCYGIQVVGSKSGTNNMKAWIMMSASNRIMHHVMNSNDLILVF